uniref:Uncharacterized LOC100183761 n=1 Tax=Ciona intestinalis TaxID=7719 RepID=F6YF73_CIOIN|nr:uncharacterized protein LOC100183761 [Ciona intestinalis]|eukprot:XP_002129320.1 uncharacterized protein LOC100183761 [Ciona intestinalis]
MADAVNYKHELCCARKIIYVSGQKSSSVFGGWVPLDDVCKKLAKWFKVSRSCFKRIENDSVYFEINRKIEALPVSPTVVSNIQAEVKKSVASCECKNLNTIVLAHSHGAKCVSHAFRSFNLNPGDLTNIYNKTAILTFGATQMVQSSASTVTRNFYFRNDSVVSFCRQLLWTSHDNCNVVPLGPFKRESRTVFKCSCCQNTAPESDVCPAGVVATLVNRFQSCSTGEDAQPQRPQSRLVGLGSGAVVAHFIEDYIECKTMKRHVKELLLVPR